MHAGKRHLCLLFEPLGLSLFDTQRFLGLPTPDATFHLPFPKLASFSLAMVRDIGYQLLTCLRYLHGSWKIHNDVKPENILLLVAEKRGAWPRDWRVRLIDYGSCVKYDPRRCGTYNTRPYRAPESVLGLLCGMEGDVWALGCVLYELRCGHPLFHPHRPAEHLALMEHVLHRRFPRAMVGRALAADGLRSSSEAAAIAHTRSVFACTLLPMVCPKFRCQLLVACILL